MSITVVPSYPAPTFAALCDLATAVIEVSPELQVDIVDGRFVSATSWPFTEVDPKAAFQALTSLPLRIALEIDCMLLQPEEWLEQFVAVGATRVVIHYGSTQAYEAIVTHARDHGYRLGLACTSDHPREVVADMLFQFSYVQVMGIAEVGKQGQPYDERTVDTVAYFRSRFPDLEIAVDGSVNADTIPPLVEAGANRLAPGSAVTQAQDPATALRTLTTLAQQSL